MAIEKDFITEYGILIQGSNVVTSSTGQTKALQVNGGAAIAKNLIVGSTATIYGATDIKSTFTVDGQTNLNDLIVNNTSSSLIVSSTNALHVLGGTWIDKDLTVEGITNLNKLVVKNLESNTATMASNALQVYGGVWIDKDLTVKGNSVFDGDVTFLGSATYVFSENSYLTDNIFNLHVPNQNINDQWTFDDGKDIGIRFQYYTNSTNTNAALVLANDTKWLEWYESGAEGQNVISNGVYGTFKTARIRLVSSENAISTTSGALTVVGGVGIGQDLWVGGNIYGNIVGTITTATNISGGAPGSLIYQSNTSTTDFISIGSTGSILQSDGFTATFVSTSSILVQYSVYSQYTDNILYGAPGQLVYQQTTSTTGFIGPGNAGQLLLSDGANGPLYVNTGNVYVGAALKSNALFGGNTGDILMQSSPNVTSFIAAGSAGDLLQSQGSTATFVSTTTLLVNRSVYSNFTENIPGGSAGQLVFQQATSSTSFIGPGTTGQILLSNGTSGPIYVNTGNVYVGTAIRSNTLLGGAAGSIPIQVSPNVTSFISSGTTGDILQSQGTTATFVSTSTLLVGAAITATMVNTVGTTSTQSFYLTFVDSNNATPTPENLYTTSSIYVNPNTGDLYLFGTLYGTIVGNVTTSTTVETVQQNNTGTYYLTFVDSNNLVPTAESIYTTDLLTVNPNTGIISIATTSTSSTLNVGGTVQITGVTTITNTTESISPTSGALVVNGGVGIGGDLFVGGTINGLTTGTVIGTISTATRVYTVEQTGNAAFYVTFVNSNNPVEIAESVYTTSSFVVNPATGNIGIGTSSPETKLHLVVESANINPIFERNDNSTGGVALSTRKSRGTNSAKTAIQSGDVIGGINGLGYDGSTYQFRGGFRFIVDGAVSTGTVPTALVIETGASTLAESLRITSANNVGIGTSSPSSKLTVNGTVSISGITTVTNTTSAISTTSGALQVVGGVGIGGNLYVGGEIVAQKLTIQLTTITTTLVQTDDIIQTLNTTNSFSTTTGALIVAGGAGIGRNLYVGDRIGWTDATNVSAVYQVYNAATNSLDTVFG